MFRFVLAGLVLAAFCSSAAADEAPPEKGTVSVLFENDIFFHSDRAYTNGVQFAWTSAPKDSWDTVTSIARDLPFFAQEGDVRTTIALGQNIYTPRNTKLSNPDPNDRPYAGYLYAEVGLINHVESGRLDQMNLQLGVVGPAALAEQTQNTTHKLINDTEANGWKYQLDNEPTAELTYERSWKLISPKSVLGLLFDVDPHIGAAVGNVYDYANVGAIARFGFPLPDDYGPVRIEPNTAGSNWFEPTGGFGAYVFAGVEGRAVARNIFLDGNTWDHSRSVDKVPFVGDLQIGAAITSNAWRLTFTHVWRSKEFEHQHYSEQFGAINLSYRY